MPLTPPPATSTPDPSGDYTRAQSWALVTAKYADAGSWATWAANLLNSNITDINKLLGSDTVSTDLAALVAEIGTITASAPGTIVGAGAGFTDTLIATLRTKLSNSITTASTGLGDAEAALFARERARQDAERAKAYTEITTQFSAKGWDMPPGALLAKQTEINNESGIRLTDSSTEIMAESARLAVDFNKHIISVSTQFLEMLSKVYESEELRKFEASKETVMLAVENYKSYLGLVKTKADIATKKAEVILDNKARQLALEVNTLAGLAQSAQQMIASALGGVSSSANFGWSGQAGTNYDGNIQQKIDAGIYKK